MPSLPALLFAPTLLVALLQPAAQPARQLQTWRLDASRFEASAGAENRPLAAGSLQKPFIAKAWAAGHPGVPPPRINCPPGRGCWNRAGHGELGLVQALALSCNTYFRSLAAATETGLLAAAFTEAGFLGVPRSPDAALGLFDGEAAPVIRPSELLKAYVRLVRTPWTRGEEVRQLVLAGLRESALTGTARGLGLRGHWAKTGTVPLEGSRTAGLALRVEDSGWAVLARLEPGTGREAAEHLAAPLTRHDLAGGGQPMGGADPGVTVRIFELLRGRPTSVRNIGPAPVPTSSGFLGAGAKVQLQAGQWAGPGLLEVHEARSGLTRRFRGRIACLGDPAGGRGLLLTCSVRDYAAGVIAAELATRSDPRRVELGATILRFLARGPRHPNADFCDSTHCAWFIGLGPQPRWPTPATAALERPQEDGAAIPEPEWEAMRTLARQSGPSQWTSHCGGQPLSPAFLWGNRDTAAPPCPRHTSSQSRPWQRTWRFADAEQAFGAPLEQLSVDQVNGMWVLRVSGPKASRTLGYDEAHRRLARVLGWGALPSPADEISRVAGGFLARGTGLGHRVGLCLAD